MAIFTKTTAFCFVVVVIGALVFANTLANAQTSTTIHNDFGVWTGFYLNKPINNRFTATYQVDFRTHKNVSQVKNFYHYFSLNYNPVKPLILHAIYRTGLKVKNDVYFNSHQFRVGATLKHRIKPVNLDIRLRELFQYGLKLPFEAHNQTHIRSTLIVRYSPKSLKTQPYMRIEYFYNTYKGETGFDEFRHQLGAAHIFNRQNELRTFYQLSGNMNKPELTYLHVWGIEYTLTLPKGFIRKKKT